MKKTLLYYRNPLMIKCCDKYDVREYIKECGLECILNECQKTKLYCLKALDETGLSNKLEKIYEQKKNSSTNITSQLSSVENNIPQSNKNVKSDISTKYSIQENENKKNRTR